MATLATDKDPAVRVAAVAGIEDINDDETIPALLKALKTDPDTQVRAAICAAWSKSMI